MSDFSGPNPHHSRTARGVVHLIDSSALPKVWRDARGALEQGDVRASPVRKLFDHFLQNLLWDVGTRVRVIPVVGVILTDSPKRQLRLDAPAVVIDSILASVIKESQVGERRQSGVFPIPRHIVQNFSAVIGDHRYIHWKRVEISKGRKNGKPSRLSDPRFRWDFVATETIFSPEALAKAAKPQPLKQNSEKPVAEIPQFTAPVPPRLIALEMAVRRVLQNSFGTFNLYDNICAGPNGDYLDVRGIDGAEKAKKIAKLLAQSFPELEVEHLQLNVDSRLVDFVRLSRKPK